MALIKDLPPDRKFHRPENLVEKKGLVRAVYGWNRWRESEHKTNCDLLGLPYYELDELSRYSEDQLNIFIADFEFHKMVLFKN